MKVARLYSYYTSRANSRATKGENMGLIDKCKAILTDPHPERDETHAATRYALDRSHCPAKPCKGASRELCATCIDTRKPLSVRKPEPITNKEIA